MAFNKSNYDPGASSKGSVPKIHRYSSSDTLATIEASGYFNSIEDIINTGDLLVVYSSAVSGGGVKVYTLTNTAGVITSAGTSVGGNGAVYLPFFINQTDLLAATSAELISPIAGRITKLMTTVQVAVTTGGAITVEVGGTPVDGLSIAVANGATKGTIQSDTPTAAHATAVVAVGSRIEIQPATDFDTAGAVSGILVIEPTT